MLCEMLCEMLWVFSIMLWGAKWEKERPSYSLRPTQNILYIFGHLNGDGQPQDGHPNNATLK
jgi:hypothetical protein